MNPRRRWLIAALAVLAVLVLLADGTRHQLVRTAAAGTPDQSTVDVLDPGQRVCEGPLVGDGVTRNVAIVGGGAAGGTAQATVEVQDAVDHARLASGQLRAPPVNQEWLVHLDREAPGGRPLRICVTDHVNALSLTGSPGSARGVTASGLPSGQRFTLILFTDRDRSLLGSLGTAFSRASLWRPSWVGPWTFWLLAIALLGTFALAIVAVLNAAADDDASASRSDPSEPGPIQPSADKRSEAGQDRPQPVS